MALGEDAVGSMLTTSRIGLAGYVGAALGAALLAVMLALGHAGVGRTFLDPDDAMRLSQVRDWIGGQAWGDLRQRRMQPPEGTPMHWSRVDDLPVAAVAWSARRAGLADGERLAMLAWPAVLVPFLVAFLCRATPRVGARRSAAIGAAGCALACATDPLLSRFWPGRIDHHAIMTTLAAGAVGTLLMRPRYATGLAAGLSAALCLGVGFEDLATLGAFGACVAVAWASGWRRAYALGTFDGTASGTAVVALAFVPDGYWRATACDMLSGGWIATICCTATFLAVGSRLSRDAPRGRTVVLCGACLVAVLAGASTLSACAAGPFAGLSPAVRAYWLSAVGEMRDVYDAAGGRLDLMVQGVVAPVAALVVTALVAVGRVRPGGAFNKEEGLGDVRRTAWAYGLVLLVATALGFRFVRDSGLPVALAAPVVGAACAWTWERGRGWRFGAIAAAASLPLAASVVELVAPDADVARAAASAEACASKAAWGPLAAMPRGLVLTPVDMGAYVLAYTGDDVVAGGYHRAARGLSDVAAFATGSLDAAREVVARDGVAYVAWCRSSPELTPTPGRPLGPTATALVAGELPAWLAPVSTDGPVAVARVDLR